MTPRRCGGVAIDAVVLGRTGREVSVAGLGCGGHSRLGQATTRLSDAGSTDDAVGIWCPKPAFGGPLSSADDALSDTRRSPYPSFGCAQRT